MAGQKLLTLKDKLKIIADRNSLQHEINEEMNLLVQNIDEHFEETKRKIKGKRDIKG